MSQNISQGLNDLITYYQGLINYNQKFANLSAINYEVLVKELITIRQLLISKTTTNINAIYKPTERLFANRDHFKTLEKTIQFYKQNSDIVYHVLEAENLQENNNIELDSTNETGLTSNVIPESQQSIDSIVMDTKTMITQLFENMNTRLSDVDKKLDALFNQGTVLDNDNDNKATQTELLSEITKINNSIDKIMNQDFFQSIAKKSQDTLTQMKTNSELVRADLSKFDELMTNHITQTGANVTEVIEKEYARFVHRISSDTSAIVDGITKSNNTELATQTKLVQTSMDKFDNKLESKFLKWFSIIFFTCAFMLFGNSVLSSSWAAKKLADTAKLVKLSITCKPPKPVNFHKSKTQPNADEIIE